MNSIERLERAIQDAHDSMDAARCGDFGSEQMLRIGGIARYLLSEGPMLLSLLKSFMGTPEGAQAFADIQGFMALFKPPHEPWEPAHGQTDPEQVE